MSQGKIVQIIGAVVDVEFPRESVPKVYDALKVDGTAITLEVQQQLGDGVVRTIALGSTDGLKRNLVASNTGSAISARRHRHLGASGRAGQRHRRAGPVKADARKSTARPSYEDRPRPTNCWKPASKLST